MVKAGEKGQKNQEQMGGHADLVKATDIGSDDGGRHNTQYREKTDGSPGIALAADPGSYGKEAKSQ